MRHTLRSIGWLALVATLAGCDGKEGGGGAQGPGGEGGVRPAKAEQTADGPVGLYFMTRYISGAGLEKKVWYFAPDGRAFEGLTEGFSEEDLKAHAGRRGTRKVEGKKMTISWADGKTSTGSFEPDEKAPPAFMWDMGIFVPVKPFDDRSVAGTYEGGESVTGSSGRAAVGHSLDLRADGTYSKSSAASVSTKTSEGSASGGATSGTVKGTWKVSGWSIVFTAEDGKTERKIAFPYDDEQTPVYPDRLFIGGTMFRRR